ncbi:MAG: TetR/AcrR family transcriptional regulator [Candidatus Lutibacillus vidarii]|jgi:DNA-binding transcriptional regulator YbjK|nr:TetR family transcriptional regulator [Candidatus Lutibacillus vidarii]
MSGARRAKTPKGQDRRQQIVDAAAEMLRVGGPGVVSHRSVARQVGCSLSAMTYYFSGLEDLLEEAGRINIARWARRAEGVAESLELGEKVSDRAAIVDHILAATLPVDEILLGHYQQLVAAGASDPVSRAYRTGRDRLNAALSRVLDSCQVDCEPALVIGLVDGAAVSALSEGRDVRATATTLLEMMLDKLEAMKSAARP